MLKKTIFFVLAMAFITQVFAQESNLNKYKYVIVPSKFDFLKEVDKFQLNSLTKFLFNKYGLTAYMDTESLPEDAKENPCLVLNSNVLQDKSLLKTKLRLEFEDCKREIIFTSITGETREKDLKKAFHEALREAFTSIEYLNYEYAPEESKTVEKEEVVVKEPKEEAKSAPKVKDVVVMGAKKEQSVQTDILYAQPINNGFQIVDTTPKVIMILLNTTKQDVFIVKDDNAVVYMEAGYWFYSKNDGTTSTTKKLNIKF